MMEYPLTDPRLLAVARQVRPGGVLADIGADHGHLICHLAARGMISYGYACDIREGPLSRSQELIQQLGLEEKVEARLTDGLTGLPLDRIDDIVIAGMGGELIGEILSRREEAKSPHLRYILQPMKKAERLRQQLCAMGFSIQREEGVQAGSHLYPVMTVSYTGESWTPDDLYCWTGLLPQSDHPDSKALLGYTAWRLRQAGRELERSPKEEAKAAWFHHLASQMERLHP